MKRIFTPEELLVAAISYYVNTEMAEEDLDLKVSARFIEDGQVEVFTLEDEEEDEAPSKKKWIN